MTRSRARRIAGCVALGLALLSPAWAHRFFVSLAEIEYDASRKAVEISLRVDDHNLEDALRTQRGLDYRLTADKAGEKAAEAYVVEGFQIAMPGGEPLPTTWVGWEWSPGVIWMYFEIPIAVEPAQRDQLVLTNTLFLELSEQQINTVNVRHGERRHTLTFDRKSRARNLFPAKP